MPRKLVDEHWQATSAICWPPRRCAPSERRSSHLGALASWPHRIRFVSLRFAASAPDAKLGCLPNSELETPASCRFAAGMIVKRFAEPSTRLASHPRAKPNSRYLWAPRERAGLKIDSFPIKRLNKWRLQELAAGVLGCLAQQWQVLWPRARAALVSHKWAFRQLNDANGRLWRRRRNLADAK